MQPRAGSRQPTFQKMNRGTPGNLLSCMVHTYASERKHSPSASVTKQGDACRGRNGQTEQLSGERIGELLSAEEDVASMAASLEVVRLFAGASESGSGVGID
ncbi:hypothetical protein E2C01_047960 [Portunus trituberculatus]|uniref:Uncharacterized protein n=1 Tax=Portunus trituberculatus TaxID=210409 RepID=A0A5B7G9X4_PORTR|nr:hypothetical protein [Portunus trituberculatus]